MAWPFEYPGPPGQVPGLPTVTRSRAGARTIRLSAKNGGGMVTVAGRARGPGLYPVLVDRVESVDCRLAGMAGVAGPLQGGGAAAGPQDCPESVSSGQ